MKLQLSGFVSTSYFLVEHNTTVSTVCIEVSVEVEVSTERSGFFTGP